MIFLIYFKISSIYILNLFLLCIRIYNMVKIYINYNNTNNIINVIFSGKIILTYHSIKIIYFNNYVHQKNIS